MITDLPTHTPHPTLHPPHTHTQHVDTGGSIHKGVKTNAAWLLPSIIIKLDEEFDIR